MMSRQEYIDYHSLEFDIIHSDCRDCYLNNLSCSHNTEEGCRVKNNDGRNKSR